MHVRMHRQPGGEMVLSTVLSDGRTVRVCGGAPWQDLIVASQFEAMLTFNGEDGDFDEAPTWSGKKKE
jgi:hypothetical protein